MMFLPACSAPHAGSLQRKRGKERRPFHLIEDNPIRLVRKGGLEPPRYCYRQPLKLVRLPIPPLPRGGPTGLPSTVVQAREDPQLRTCYFAGAGAGAPGADAGSCCERPPTTEPGPRCPRMPSAIAPMTNSKAHTVVARDNT